MEIFQYLFLLIFSNRSMYINLITGRNTPDFAKDTAYRFMKMIQINWIRFTTTLSARIIRDAILPLDSEDRANVLIIDDSMFERNRSKRLNSLPKSITMQNINIALDFECLRQAGPMEVPSCQSTAFFFPQKTEKPYQWSNRSRQTNRWLQTQKAINGKGTQAMLTLLDAARKAAIPAKYVLLIVGFITKYSSCCKNKGYDVIGMVKKTPKMFFVTMAKICL